MQGMDCETRKAMAIALKAQPPKADLPGQKFKRGSKVHVCKDLGPMMRHFTNDFDAIVQYTYAQKFGGSDIENYALVVLDGAGEPINEEAWYWEDQLTLLSDDIEAGLKIIEISEGDVMSETLRNPKNGLKTFSEVREYLEKRGAEMFEIKAHLDGINGKE